MEGSQCLGVESSLNPESGQQDVCCTRREGGAGGEAVAGCEPHEDAGTKRLQRRDGGKEAGSWRKREKSELASGGMYTVHVYT